MRGFTAANSGALMLPDVGRLPRFAEKQRAKVITIPRPRGAYGGGGNGWRAPKARSVQVLERWLDTLKGEREDEQP